MQSDRISNYASRVWLALIIAEMSTASKQKLFTIAEKSLSTTKKENYTSTLYEFRNLSDLAQD